MDGGASVGEQHPMDFISRIALSLAAAAVPAAMAAAADYEPPIYVEDVAEVPVEIGSGWYLRGDIGYALESDIGRVTFRTFDPLTSAYGSGAFSSQELDKSFTWGGGFGYQFNEWLRADLTADGFRADFHGHTSSADPCTGFPDGTGCRSENGSEVSAVSALANAYVDLGTVAGFTPYVGAGAGYSFVSWGGGVDRRFCTDGIVLCPGPGGVVSSSRHDGEDGWRFTYALMAGVAYDIDDNFKLDFGYKYRRIDGGDMFGWDNLSAALGASGTQGTHGDIEQHELRVGLRYEIW